MRDVEMHGIGSRPAPRRVRVAVFGGTDLLAQRVVDAVDGAVERAPVW
jgi:hypothetical protein